MNYSQSALFFGFLLGSYMFGWLSDRYGRYKTVVISMFSSMVLGLLGALVPSIYYFTAYRLTVGFVIAGSISYYVLTYELLGAQYRSCLAVTNAVFFSVGFVIVSLLAYVIGTWRPLIMLSAVLLVPFIVTLK